MSEKIPAVLYKYGQQSEILLEQPDDEVSRSMEEYMSAVAEMNGFPDSYAYYQFSEKSDTIYVYSQEESSTESKFIVSINRDEFDHYFIGHTLLDLSEIVNKIYSLTTLREIPYSPEALKDIENRKLQAIHGLSEVE